MVTSPVTDRVEIERGDVLQIDFFNIFPLFYLLYLSSIQKKRGGPRSCIDARSDRNQYYYPRQPATRYSESEYIQLVSQGGRTMYDQYRSTYTIRAHCLYVYIHTCIYMYAYMYIHYTVHIAVLRITYYQLAEARQSRSIIIS